MTAASQQACSLAAAEWPGQKSHLACQHSCCTMEGKGRQDVKGCNNKYIGSFEACRQLLWLLLPGLPAPPLT